MSIPIPTFGWSQISASERDELERSPRV